MRPIRLFVLCAAAVVVGSDALAGGPLDEAILRGSSYNDRPPVLPRYVPGSPIRYRWEGFYIGAQAGYGSAHIDFSGATEHLFAFMFRDLAVEQQFHPSRWQVLGSKSTSSASWGGFIGYNAVFEDAVVGFDVHYSGTDFFAEAPSDPIGRSVTTTGGNTYALDLSGTASMAIKDWGAARVRGGWIADNFMPYATLGVAFGRADFTRTATFNGTETTSGTPPVVTPFSDFKSETRNDVWIYGWSAGLGVDVLVTPNLFLRGEYEYASFFEVAGIKAEINTIRAGAAYKF